MLIYTQILVAIVATIGGISLLGAIIRFNAIGVTDKSAIWLSLIAIGCFAALLFA